MHERPSESASTYPTPCCAKSPSVTTCAVLIGGRTTADVRLGRFSKFIMSGPGRGAARKRSTTCGCFALRTINCSPSVTSEQFTEQRGSASVFDDLNVHFNATTPAWLASPDQ